MRATLVLLAATLGQALHLAPRGPLARSRSSATSPAARAVTATMAAPRDETPKSLFSPGAAAAECARATAASHTWPNASHPLTQILLCIQNNRVMDRLRI